MGIAMSLGVFAIGAILGFAVRTEPSGLDLPAVGAILMLVGGVGVGVSLYRERWRRRIFEESIETGAGRPDADVSDPEPDYNPARVVVHEHVFTGTDRTAWDARMRPNHAAYSGFSGPDDEPRTGPIVRA
jgi:hypothetical protein